jgi:hypothetical protein
MANISKERRNYLMAYEIIGETIKSATSIKLGQIFDNPKRYKETVSKPVYPNFYITQLNLTITPTGRKRVQLDYLMNIQYRVAENTETISNLQQRLDEVGLKLCTELTELNLERPTKTKNRDYEKADGVLQMFFNITVYALPEQEKIAKMQTYKLNEEVI